MLSSLVNIAAKTFGIPQKGFVHLPMSKESGEINLSLCDYICTPISITKKHPKLPNCWIAQDGIGNSILVHKDWLSKDFEEDSNVKYLESLGKLDEDERQKLHKELPLFLTRMLELERPSRSCTIDFVQHITEGEIIWVSIP